MKLLPPGDSDQEQFSRLFRSEFPRVARAATLIIGDADLGREVSQEAFARVWTRWTAFESLEHAKNFAFATALNVARSHRRRSRRLRSLLVSDEPDTGDPRHSTDTIDFRLAIATSLGRLSNRQRTCLVMVDYVGYPTEDVARLLGMRSSTVRVHLSRARARLASDLSEAKEDLR